MNERLISVDIIPSNLWNKKDEILYLPELLTMSWEKLLVENNLLELSKEISPKGFEGGISEDDTNKHLAWRYNGSCGRVILSILDPKNELKNISNTYAKLFSGNNVFIADVPIGSGATAISIITTLYELRKSDILPRHPLNIKITAGEISEHAIKFAISQLDLLCQKVADQAIHIEYDIERWDVLDPISTSDLMKKITISSHKCESKLLILSNFSGFLANDGKWKKAKPQIDEMFRYFRDENSAAIWIEPQRKTIKNLFDNIKDWFSSRFGILGEIPDENHSESSCKTYNPIQENTFPVRLSIKKFDLNFK